MQENDFETRLKVFKNQWNIPDEMVKQLRKQYQANFPVNWDRYFELAYFDGQYLRSIALGTVQ